MKLAHVVLARWNELVSSFSTQETKGADCDEHHGWQRGGNPQGDQRAPEESQSLFSSGQRSVFCLAQSS
jgi:hypothetical protein